MVAAWDRRQGRFDLRTPGPCSRVCLCPSLTVSANSPLHTCTSWGEFTVVVLQLEAVEGNQTSYCPCSKLASSLTRETPRYRPIEIARAISYAHRLIEAVTKSDGRCAGRWKLAGTSCEALRVAQQDLLHRSNPCLSYPILAASYPWLYKICWYWFHAVSSGMC